MKKATAFAKPLALALAALAGCTLEKPSEEWSGLRAGVTFTYPRDGQVDVPIGGRLVLHLTDGIATGALPTKCTLDSEGTPREAFCLLGPEGPVAFDLEVAGAAGNVLLVQPSSLRGGTRYEVYASPALLGLPLTNLRANAPLISFRTRQSDPLAGQVPTLVAVNDGDPAAYAASPQVAPPLPFLTFSTVRLLFSEPLAEASVLLGSSFRFERIDPASSVRSPVSGLLVARDSHVSFDPDEDLDPTATYQLSLRDVRDLNGEVVAPTVLTFRPQAAWPQGQPLEQILSLSSTDEAGGDLLSLVGLPANRTSFEAPLTGESTLQLLPGALRSQIGDPAAFGGPVPFIVRKGQQLVLSSLDIHYGGALRSGNQTGTIHFVLLTDATGYMMRNPLRPADTRPDDLLAPVTVDLVLDAAMYAEDPLGNAVSTQTAMSLHALGTAVPKDGRLVLEAVASAELDVLGAARAPLLLTMRMQTDPSSTSTTELTGPMTLVASNPAPGPGTFPVDSPLTLVFSHPVDRDSVLGPNGPVLTHISTGASVPLDVQIDGARLILRPTTTLRYGASYRLNVRPVKDVAGQRATFSSSDPTEGTGMLSFSITALSADRPAAPVLLAMYPGGPCALTGATTASGGRCVGGEDSDDTFLAFKVPSDRRLEAEFNQPMSRASMQLGNACGRGSIRVEQYDAAGRCVSPVPGTLSVRERGFEFVPNTPWTVGGSYRLTLVAGNDATCGSGELCGANGLPFNTDPLNGISAADAPGGPALVAPFTGAAAATTVESFQVLSTLPSIDQNGNGFWDTGELAVGTNYFEVELVDTGGAVSSASLNGVDCDSARPGKQVCVGVRMYQLYSARAPIAHCPVDENGESTFNGTPCIPVRLYAGSMQATSMSLNAKAIGMFEFTEDTGFLFMRSREIGPNGAMGYILKARDGQIVFVFTQRIYLDAPDMSLLGGTVSHDLKSKAVDILLKGPVTITENGRMQLEMSNVHDVLMSISITGGSIQMRIPARTLHMATRTPTR